MGRERIGWDGYGPWSREALMLAEVRDCVMHVVYALVRVNGGKIPPPEPFPRPGVVPASIRNEPDPAAVAFLTRRRELHRQQQQQAAAE